MVDLEDGDLHACSGQWIFNVVMISSDLNLANLVIYDLLMGLSNKGWGKAAAT